MAIENGCVLCEVTVCIVLVDQLMQLICTFFTFRRNKCSYVVYYERKPHACATVCECVINVFSFSCII